MAPGPLPTDETHVLSRAYAKELDACDTLSHFRDEFYIPTIADVSSSSDLPQSQPVNGTAPSTSIKSKPCIYFCGNSLGLQPKRAATLINDELAIWATKGVIGHFDHPKSKPWVTINENIVGHLSGVVGAKVGEVAPMGTLSANIHMLLAAFYRPTGKRWKIIMEGKAFPSDHVCGTIYDRSNYISGMELMWD